MKKVCDTCIYQETDINYRGGVKCGATTYFYNEGFGPFKNNAVCIHDSDLKDLYTPKTNEEPPVKDIAAILAAQSEEISELKEVVRLLKNRLTTTVY